MGTPEPRALRDVVFVDGVRTAFGRAGEKGLYAETRADDMVVAVIRELLRRHPYLPPERIDDVAIAAATQIGDQGLTLGRIATILAGLPRSVPGYSIDRMCAGAMTAVTTLAGGIAFGAYTWPSLVASSTWAITRWAKAPIPTRGSSRRNWWTSRHCRWVRPRRICTIASRT